MEKPELIENPDLSKVIQLFEEMHTEILLDEFHEDSDNKQYIFETIAEALYGDDYFKWFNENAYR